MHLPGWTTVWVFVSTWSEERMPGLFRLLQIHACFRVLPWQNLNTWKKKKWKRGHPSLSKTHTSIHYSLRADGKHKKEKIAKVGQREKSQWKILGPIIFHVHANRQHHQPNARAEPSTKRGRGSNHVKWSQSAQNARATWLFGLSNCRNIRVQTDEPRWPRGQPLAWQPSLPPPGRRRQCSCPVIVIVQYARDTAGSTPHESMSTILAPALQQLKIIDTKDRLLTSLSTYTRHVYSCVLYTDACIHAEVTPHKCMSAISGNALQQ